MMKTICFSMPGNESLTSELTKKLSCPRGKMVLRHFPDGETYLQIVSDVTHKTVVIVCTLHQPDEKLLPLYYLAKASKDQGASHVYLIAPYLAYMRQDIQFHPGEAVTSKYFGALISQFIDGLITVDPHLHRRKSLGEIYSIPTQVIHVADHIAQWVKTHVEKPLFIGPDSESKQWVAEVAKDAGAPYLVLTKTRYSDEEVKVSVPQVENYKDHTPVLVDDIISTAQTMIEAVKQLHKIGMKPPVCIGVHAVFAQNAYKNLLEVRPNKVITCNTIIHETNAIDISDLLIYGFNQLKP